MIRRIILSILLFTILIIGIGCRATDNKDIYAVVIGKFTANSPQLEDGFYTAFLTDVPANFEIVFFPKELEYIYDASLFGEINTFYLKLGDVNGYEKWIVIRVKNAQHNVGSLWY